MKLESLLNTLNSRTGMVRIHDKNSGEVAEGSVKQIIEWAQGLNETFNSECDFEIQGGSKSMERGKLLLEITEQLLEEAANKIGWDMDGSEIDLITMSPQWESAVSGTNLQEQLKDVMYVINEWAKNTKLNYMVNGKRIDD